MKWVAPLLAAALCLPTAAPEPPMKQSAAAFLDSLGKDLRAKAVLPFASDEKERWAYTPGPRPGVSWADLNAAQKEAAKRLLVAALGEPGAEKVEAIRQLEPILREMERGNPGRDPERYWFVFFGEPSGDRWAWRYEGHHVSLSFTVLGNSVVSSTPQFLGTNPAESRDLRQPATSSKGRRVLDKEQDLAFAFADMLTPSQWAKARLAATAPGDIVTTNSRKASIEDRRGLPWADLTSSQREGLKRLVEAHTFVQSPAERIKRLEDIGREGWDKLVFAWMGPKERRARHYYRILGEGFVIEFDCTQDDGNHIHTVWRRLDGDFPSDPLADPLAAHYREHH